ncbi:unnamed protein product [Arctogadus glacialis]
MPRTKWIQPSNGEENWTRRCHLGSLNPVLFLRINKNTHRVRAATKQRKRNARALNVFQSQSGHADDGNVDHLGTQTHTQCQRPSLTLSTLSQPLHMLPGRLTSTVLRDGMGSVVPQKNAWSERTGGLLDCLSARYLLEMFYKTNKNMLRAFADGCSVLMSLCFQFL